MNELQKQKALAALEQNKERERKQHRAMFHHMVAFHKLHFMGVLLPYRVLIDIEKAEHDGTFREISPNPFYPAPAQSLNARQSMPLSPDNADADYLKYVEYQRQAEGEKTPIDKWGYWYARFLLPYDIESFTDFDFWGKIPESEEEKQAVESLRAACLEVWRDCKKNPQNYNTEPVLRKKEHETMYDVPYGYFKESEAGNGFS